jgi:signal transduction histidine kinase
MIIKDSGIGIEKENLGKLFHNFSKLADSQGLNAQGTGLGLSICKHII